jgi:hypothetical protein
MEQSSITVESVRNLQASGKRLLENLLGQQLQEDQQVFIMVLSPGSEPNESARRQARLALEATFRKTEANAIQNGASDEEIEAAIQEAIRQIRSGKD